jgi:hypothetical protein
MGKHFRAGWAAITLLVILAALSAFGTRRSFAADDQPPGPDRFKIVIQTFTRYEWWLTGWADNQVACTIKVDHDGLPTGGEINAVCGKTIYNKWIATKPCSTDGICSGYYLLMAGTEPAQREVGVPLPPPVVWVTLKGCDPYRSTNRCSSLPTLILTGEEPLVGEHITSLAVILDGKAFTCDAVCQVDLAPTDENGISLDFWGNSSYGDSSELFTAQVRVVASDDTENHGWFVDVLSTQWRGQDLAGCSMIWNAFPPVGGVPDWLYTPGSGQDLATNIPYEYLAAKLITNGVADASTCDDGGLLQNGLASTCGLVSSRTAVNDWQNRFDNLIFNSAVDTGVPAQLLKNTFARESQFWPGMLINGQPEVGLGQMTDNGADTTLLWNQPFFEQFCPSVLDNATCQVNYPLLAAGKQLTLRKSLIKAVDATCPDCEMGVDLDRAENSIGIFAESMLANCTQAGRIVHNVYGGNAGASASYEDLWRFTLVNYNGGPGCLTLAINDTRRRNEKLNWANLSSHLTPACQGALTYVTQVSGTAP